MIPGIGRLDSSFANSGGGFESVISIGDHIQRRDALISIYRDAHFAVRGLHVIDPHQAIGDPELPDGQPMTMELRQKIAEARSRAGKIPGEDGTDYINDPELDGIVDAPDWARISEHINLTLCPGKVVAPVELACPTGEVADRVNAEFWDLVATTPDEAVDIVGGAVEAWITQASKTLAVWPAQTPERGSADIRGRIEASGTVTPEELRRRGCSLRQWVMDVLAATIVERLDREFIGSLPLHPIQSYDDLVNWAGGSPLLGVVFTESAGNALLAGGGETRLLADSSAFALSNHPLGDHDILAVRRGVGTSPARLETTLALDDRALTITLTYHHTPRTPGPDQAVIHRVTED